MREKKKNKKIIIEEIHNDLFYQYEYKFSSDKNYKVELIKHLYQICVTNDIDIYESIVSPKLSKKLDVYWKNDPISMKINYWKNFLNLLNLHISKMTHNYDRNKIIFTMIKKAFIKAKINKEDLKMIARILDSRHIYSSPSGGLFIDLGFSWKKEFMGLMYENPDKCSICNKYLHRQGVFPKNYPDKWKLCCNCWADYDSYIEEEIHNLSNKMSPHYLSSSPRITSKKLLYKTFALEWAE